MSRASSAALLALVAVETLINLVLEIYRPRVKGKVAASLYESRLVGLLGQPEGLITTAAQALDYQFGFKVSETWFYRFFEKALGWLLLLPVGGAVSSTCVVFIEAGRTGCARTFRPISKRTRDCCSTGRPFEMAVADRPCLSLPHRSDSNLHHWAHAGRKASKGKTRCYGPCRTRRRRTISWWPTASRIRTANTNAATGKRTPPVSFLTVSIPVQYQINNLLAWAYNNVDPPLLLQDIATREVVRYLVGADMNEIMSSHRAEAANTHAARTHSVRRGRAPPGRDVVFVGLQGIASAGESGSGLRSGGERQPEEDRRHQGCPRRKRSAPTRWPEPQATNMINKAIASSNDARKMNAFAQAAAFSNQIPAYEAAPSVYQRAGVFEGLRQQHGQCAQIRFADDQYARRDGHFDLQDKVRADLLI